MSEPVKLTSQELTAIIRGVAYCLIQQPANPLLSKAFDRIETFARSHVDKHTFFLVTEQDTMRAQIAVKAMHDTLDLEHRLAQDEHRIFQLEARNQQNSERIAYLQQQLEQMRKKEE